MAEKMTIVDPPAREAPDRDRMRQCYLVFDQSLRVIHASKSLRTVLRLSEAPSPADDVMSLLERVVGPEPESVRAVKHWLDRIAVRPREDAGSTLALLTSEGARTVHAKLDALGEQYWIAAFEDVTEQLTAESEMTAIAYSDPLTGMANRSFFEQRLDQTLERVAARELPSATVLFLDLDRFKVVNDTLGHAVGDALLRTVGERLKSTLRQEDTLARMGGDEFAVVLANGSGKDIASALAVRVIDLIQRPYLIDGHVINVGASIGIANAPDDGQSRDHLLKSADLALYHSKSAGRGVFHFFSPDMEERAQQRRSLELDLRKALVLRQFELHYQPQIDVESQQITALEGLLRWRHPLRGLVLPGDFLSLAEEIGLAVPIGNWVLKTACLEAMRWPDRVTIAVNVSPLQFEMSKFDQSVEQALRAAGLPGRRLEIEVTEDVLLRDGQAVFGTLEALRALGVRVAMDNFGIGLASMSQLVNFPFDKIKIDRSLVDLQHGGAKNRAVVRAISALGQSLGIETLAEGIETSDHLALVRSEGCTAVQGFYYSEAVPSSDLVRLFPSLSRGKEVIDQQTGGES